MELPLQRRGKRITGGYRGWGGTTPSLHGRYTRLARFDFVTESKERVEMRVDGSLLPLVCTGDTYAAVG
ncbi:hypothetical protein, partial [Bacteroides caccae]|uniref:hypothetical protein n=1 Tax=Bacteroides caccae TaxID=47678 RepID=UPI0032EB587A